MMNAWLTVDSEAMLERLTLIATSKTIDKEKLAHSGQAQFARECVRVWKEEGVEHELILLVANWYYSASSAFPLRPQVHTYFQRICNVFFLWFFGVMLPKQQKHQVVSHDMASKKAPISTKPQYT